MQSELDDIELLPFTTETTEALYRVVDAAYEKRSIALSSRLHPPASKSSWPNDRQRHLDRLLHHAQVVINNGDSIRPTQATRDRGVRPLTN